MGEAATRTSRRPFLLGLDHLVGLRRHQLDFYRHMQARHGDVVRLRLGPYRLWLLFHPAEIETVLTAESARFVRFEPVMRVLSQWNGRSLLVSEGDRWRGRRRRVLPAFASRRLPAYGERVVARTEAMLDAWRGRAVDGIARLDTDREMVALTLDIAADTLFGEPLGARAESAGAAVATLSEVAFRESTSPIRLPAWLPTRHNARKRAAVAEMASLVGTLVASRLADPDADRGDLLSILVAEGRADPAGIADEVMTLLIAGHETSGAALSWASALLGQHPDMRAGIEAEIDESLEGRPARAQDLERLPRLRAAIAETLRLYPPAYALFPRRALVDVEIGRAAIRAGDVVQIVPFVTQRDPRWFPDPDAFRPERFLDRPTWPTYAYLAFGAGPRVCIGQGFALTELGLALATILRQASPSAPEGVLEAEPRFSLRPRGGLVQAWRFRPGPRPGGPSPVIPFAPVLL